MIKKDRSKQLMITSNSLVKFFCLGTISLLISACGFNLRQAPPLPENLTYIELACPGKSHWHLCQEAKRSLENSGALLDKESQYLLTLSPSNPDQRVISIQSDASVAEYQYAKELAFRLEHRPSAKILLKDKVQASKIYRHDDSALLSQEREAQELQEILNRELMAAVLRQLSSVNLETATQD